MNLETQLSGYRAMLDVLGEECDHPPYFVQTGIPMVCLVCDKEFYGDNSNVIFTQTDANGNDVAAV